MGERVPGSVGRLGEYPGFDSGTLCRWENRPPIPTGRPINVLEMDLESRFGESLRRTAPLLPAEFREEFEELLTPTNLAIVAGVLAVWGASHAFGIGVVVDVLLLITGALFLGVQIWSVAGDFAGFIDKTINARTSCDLDQAAAHLANFIAVVGVAGLLALLAKGAKGKGPKMTALRTRLSKDLNYYSRIVLGWGHKPTAVMQRLDIAVQFFSRNGKGIREFEGGLSQAKADDYVRGIDFSQDVMLKHLNSKASVSDLVGGAQQGKLRLIQYTDQHQTNFYTLSGTSPGNLAIPNPTGKKHVVYEVVGENVEVLVSRTSPLGPKQAGEHVFGGGWQIIIPNPAQNLKVLPKP
jgi:hypothetical protein